MGKCIICNRYAKNEHFFCKECYRKVSEMYDDMCDDYDNEYQIKNEYFSIKRLCINNNLSKSKLNYNLKKIYNLADIYFYIFDSNYLIDRIEDDINDIINQQLENDLEDINDNYNELENYHEKSNNNSFDDNDYRKQWPNNIQCEDGHYVRSKAEKIIDDWLYHHDIVHAYEKSVYMKTNPSDVVLSDFYIPKIDVYIEYWGLKNNQDYENRKRYKIYLYEQNNYKRIDLDETHINRIDDVLPRFLGKYYK